MSDTYEFDSKKLDNLIKMFTENKSAAAVGIMGDKNARSKGSNTNAMIGLKHEMGVGVKQRSWLRKPIIEEFQHYLAQSGIDSPEAFNEMVKSKSLDAWIKKFGVVGELVVAEAFASNGFGKWAPHAQGYTNNTGDILVDTQQLRNSVTSQVVVSNDQ